jgi:beta-galactosidase
VKATANLATSARVQPLLVAPVAIMLRKGKLSLTTVTPDAAIKYRLNGEPAQTALTPLTAQGGDQLIAWAERAGWQSSGVTTLTVPAEADRARYAIKYVSSQQLDEGEAEHLIDGDPDTYWHTEYALTLTKYPHTVDIDLGAEKSFKAISYLPRQDSANGRVAKYQFAIGDDGTNWMTVVEGQFPRGSERQVVALKAPVWARYLRFVALSELEGRDFASAAEIDIVP